MRGFMGLFVEDAREIRKLIEKARENGGLLDKVPYTIHCTFEFGDINPVNDVNEYTVKIVGYGRNKGQLPRAKAPGLAERQAG